jgi:hypothetical protein
VTALRLLVLGAWVLGARTPERPQPQSPPQAPVSPTPGLQVALVTLGEGEYYWEKFGHNALWFYAPADGIDVIFNWGTFDFAEPGFLGKVLLANQRYWVDTIASRYFFEFYRRADRSITIQRLNFTPEQAQKAFQYATWNAREENRYYRYDYFRDNCSTRVRDVIDMALGGALKRSTGNSRSSQTYRSHTLRLVDDMPVTQFAIAVALGTPSDRPITLWEEMFVPSRVMEIARSIQRGNAGRPLVAEERELYRSRSHAERTDRPTLWVGYLIVGLLLGAELLLVGRLGERARAADVVFRVEAALWALLTGLLGALVLLAWLITQHVFWFRNENLLLFNPIALFLAVLVLLSLWRPRWLRAAAICAAIAAMLAALALVLKGLPGFPQDNLALVVLVLPPHFAIAYGLWRRSTFVTPRGTA